jgi:uncharacterized protein YqhQ
MGDNCKQTDKERLKYGGQAVVEGVMMRSPHFFAVACRKESDKSIVVEVEKVESVGNRWGWLKLPLIRGVAAMADSLVMGTKALMYSANLQVEDADTSDRKPTVGLALDDRAAAGEPASESASASAKPVITSLAMSVTAVVSLALGIGLFWVLPTLMTELLDRHFGIHTIGARAQFNANLCDGLFRIAIFLAYVLFISRMENVRRVFQYHGAEHKAMNTLEAGLDLTVENARKASRIHPRCGTNFIFIVLIVSIFVIALFGRPVFYIRVPLHLACVFVIVGISYEILKLAGKCGRTWWARALMAPGLLTQYLTTRPPDDSMIEVAIAALQSVWDREHEAESGGGGSSLPTADLDIDKDQISAVA